MNKPQQSKITPISRLQTNVPKKLDIPESEKAEEALIAAMLYNPNLIPEVAAALDDNAWFYIRHKMIWDAMIELTNNGTTVDMVTLPEYMVTLPSDTNQTVLHDIGGPAQLTRLLSDYSTGHSSYKDYVEIINSAYRRRCMLAASEDLRRAALNYDLEIVKSVNRAYESLDKLSDKTRTFTTIADGLHKHMDIAEERRANPIAMGIPSGIKLLDDMLDGFHKRRVYIVAARKQHGKTAMLSTITLHAASQGARVGFFNVADGNTQDVVSRIVGIECGMNIHEVLMGRVKADGYSRYSEASCKVSKYPIFIESDKGMSLPELLIKARNMKYRHGLDMICIDYIQRIGIDTTKKGAPQTRAEQLAYISKTITKLADETFLDMPIIVGAQLNRGADGRRPGIADIKGSGAIEEDADAIIMPYRENFSDDLIELIVGVNKITGRTGTVEARINPVSTKIENKGW